MAIEQKIDVIFQQLKLKIQKEKYSETILLQDIRYQHYLRQLDRMSIQGEIITRQYYDETGNAKYNQVLLPKHLVTELLELLHGKANRHPGIAKLLLTRNEIQILLPRNSNTCPQMGKWM